MHLKTSTHQLEKFYNKDNYPFHSPGGGICFSDSDIPACLKTRDLNTKLAPLSSACDLSTFDMAIAELYCPGLGAKIKEECELFFF